MFVTMVLAAIKFAVVVVITCPIRTRSILFNVSTPTLLVTLAVNTEVNEISSILLLKFTQLNPV